MLGERGRIANCGQINKLKCVGDEMLKSSGDKGVVNVEWESDDAFKLILQF